MTKFAELVEILKSDAYTTKEALDQALSRFLRHGRRNYICNRTQHQKGSETVQITNFKGKWGCGCFACSSTDTYCRNAIDIYMTFGGYMDFKDAVFAAAEDFGIITAVDADELRKAMENKGHSTSSIKIRKQVVAPQVNHWYEQKPVDPDKVDLIYRLFTNLRHLAGLPRLSPKHLDELTNKRNLSEEEIWAIGFFTFPDVPISYLIEAMEKVGLVADDLKYVSGFYYDLDKKSYDYQRISDAYGIPIRGIDGKIIAIQLRLTDEKASCRYIWFSSNKHMQDEEGTDRKCYGNTSGTPLAIIRPKTLKNKSLLITEGFYKAYAFSKEYGCTAIAVQGVQNINGIEDVIEKLREEGLANCIMIAFDADMAVNTNVLKPALRLAAKVSNMSEEMFEKLQYKICLGGSKDETTIATNYVKEAEEIKSFFMTQKKLYFLTWDMELEKGIDDLIQAGHKDAIQHPQAADFFEKAYNVLCQIDLRKMEISKAKGCKFIDAYVPDAELKTIFYETVLKTEQAKNG